MRVTGTRPSSALGRHPRGGPADPGGAEDLDPACRRELFRRADLEPLLQVRRDDLPRAHHGRRILRRLLPRRRHASEADGRLRAQGQGRALLRSAPGDGPLQRRAAVRPVRALDRGALPPGRRGRLRHARRAELLPGRPRAPGPDGRLPAPHARRRRLRPSGLLGHLRRRRVPGPLHRLHRRALGAGDRGGMRRSQLLPAQPDDARADGSVSGEDVRSQLLWDRYR